MKTLEPYEGLSAQDHPYPEISRGLVYALLARIPHVDPVPGMAPDRIMYLSGRRSVVEELLQEFARQQSDRPGGVVIQDHGNIR